MTTPTVIEAPFEFEPVTADTFGADLDQRSSERDMRVAAFVARLAASPRRRIYD